MRLRTLSNSESDPQAKSITLSRRCFFPVAGSWLSSCHDGREDVGNLLRRVELARLLARAGGKLAHQVFISLAQRINVGGEPRQTLGDFSDDGAELRITLCVLLAQLGGTQVNF